MIRRCTGIFFAAVLAVGLSLPAEAAQGEGSILVSLDAGELPVLNGAMTLYTVGVPVEGGYHMVEAFGGGFVRQEDAQSLQLAQWLAENAEEGGRTVNLDVDGNVSFSNLEDGLYLLVQTERMDGFYPVKPFLLTVPGEAGREVRAKPQTEPIVAENPRTGQPITPLLGAMGLVISGVGLYLCAESKRKK